MPNKAYRGAKTILRDFDKGGNKNKKEKEVVKKKGSNETGLSSLGFYSGLAYSGYFPVEPDKR